jgi:hypothetical protein
MQRGISPRINMEQVPVVYSKLLGLVVIIQLGLGSINIVLQWFIPVEINCVER